MRRVWLVLLWASVWASAAEFRVERQAVLDDGPGGAELLTVFGHLSSGTGQKTLDEVPLVSVLRDTLGDKDPENDRLRYIWVLTSARPTVLQRALAALPFYYHQPDLSKNADHRPVPVIDLSDTTRSVFTAVAAQIMQVAALDPYGAAIRSSTRSYRSNATDHRRVHLMEGLAVLSQLENVPEIDTLLSEPELFEIQARLALAGTTLGGLVNGDHLPDAYFKQRERTEEMRGHNWEMLRQRAETNGLYFEPFGLTSSKTHALLWIAREDLAKTTHPFDGRFLNIQNPYTDARLRRWDGFVMRAYFDADRRRVAQPVPGGSERDLIPLALYSLEYPRVPLLLADFRKVWGPKRREILRRATSDALIGVFGISRWGNWPYFAGSVAFNYVRSKHGDPNSRANRLKAYSQTRRWLALDHALDPDLKAELLHRLEFLGVNPLQESVFEEAKIGTRQYEALMKYAIDPKGLRAQLNRDRNAERTSYEHKWAARAGLQVAHVFSFGLYQHREADQSSLLMALDQRRRMDRELRYLESVASSGPQPEPKLNPQQIERALDQLADKAVRDRMIQAVERIIRQTPEGETRAALQRALENLDAAGQ
jgi:hypothetical protein